MRQQGADITQKESTKGKGKQQITQAVPGAITDMQMHSLEAELKRTGVGMEAVKERYKIEQPEQMSEELYKKVMSALKRTKSAA